MSLNDSQNDSHSSFVMDICWSQGEEASLGYHPKEVDHCLLFDFLTTSSMPLFWIKLYVSDMHMDNCLGKELFSQLLHLWPPILDWECLFSSHPGFGAEIDEGFPNEWTGGLQSATLLFQSLDAENSVSFNIRCSWLLADLSNPVSRTFDMTNQFLCEYQITQIDV